MTDTDTEFDAEYAGDLKDDAAVTDKLPEPDASSPPDEGDAGQAGVKGGAR